MAKAQNGLGVGDEGSPAYTLDTRGLQAVGVSEPEGRAWGIASDAVDRSGEGADGSAAARPGLGISEELSPTLRARHPNAVASVLPSGPVSSGPVDAAQEGDEARAGDDVDVLPVAVAFNQRDEARTSPTGYTLQSQPGGDEQLVLTGSDSGVDPVVPFRKSRRAATNTDDETWVHDPVRANTVNTFDVGDTRATELIVTGWCACKRNRDDEWTDDGRHARCGLPTQGGTAVPLDLRATGKNDSGGAGTSGDGIGQAGDPAPTLGVSSATPGVCVPGQGAGPVAFSAKDHGQDAGEVSPTLRAMGHTSSHANGGGQVGVVIPDPEQAPTTAGAEGKDGAGAVPEGSGSQAFTAIEFGHYKPGVGTLKASDGRRPETHVVVDEEDPAPDTTDTRQGVPGAGVQQPGRAVVRRITPVEAERLQGFADGWTEFRLSATGVPVAQADSARYKQMGNAVAVPCPAWVGARVVAAHTGLPHPEVGSAGWPVGADPVTHTTGVADLVEEPGDDGE